MKIRFVPFCLATLFPLSLLAQEPPKPAKPATPAPKPKQEAGLAVNENKATPAERIRAPKGFKVELLHSVPFAEQGSWVNLAFDNKGRILASDQYGGLYRFPAPPAGQPLDPATIEKVPADIRAANGLLWAFDALWVAVNDYENKIDSGLYRITDSDGDDKLDKVEKIRPMQARGDHGVHAVLLAPDGKSLFLITGNSTKPTEANHSRVPKFVGEDHLLPRMPDGRGFMREVLGPGGIIYQITPDGKDWTVYSSGFRNIFDGAFNRAGELFTYDADMEYDFNTPWYRPTRVNHVTSGSEFGWRNGAGKWPAWYPDNLGSVVDIGPGSPCGVVFGYGAKFPSKYQEALYCLDWSWGKLYAIHLKPQGSSYVGVKEEFVSGAPLPLTDAIINPADGAMYFAIGGRKVQSGLYRVSYTGTESTAPSTSTPGGEAERAARHALEAFHKQDAGAVKAAWPKLGDSDREIRWAARTAIEHQPKAEWAAQAFAETDTNKRLEALLALARVGGIDPFHRKPEDAPVDTALRDQLLEALTKFDWAKLDSAQRITLTRTLQIVLNRYGKPDEAGAQKLLAKFDPAFPDTSYEVNWLLGEALVFLQSPSVAPKLVALLQKAPTQEEQMQHARTLRMLKAGWTTETHTAYFDWLLRAANYRGGASFEKFIEFIRNDAVASLSDAEKEQLKDVLARKPVKQSPLEALGNLMAGRNFVKAWTVEDLAPAAANGMKDRNFDNGRKMFGAVGCFACHRFGAEGGMTGPDLSGSGGRYTAHDLIDQIINPSKEINEQFVPQVLTKLNGEQVIGVIVNLNGDSVQVNTDPADPNQRIGVDRKTVQSIEPSKISPMPPGLLNLLTQDEILDLCAYVLSGGDPKNAMFKK